MVWEKFEVELQCSQNTYANFSPKNMVKVRQRLYTIQLVYQAGAYPGFRSMKQLG